MTVVSHSLKVYTNGREIYVLQVYRFLSLSVELQNIPNAPSIT